jgi:hypothetical protein
MSRAYLFYFLMAAILASGLWLILTYGNTLAAPQDLSGDWFVQWDEPRPGFTPSGNLHIDQSGRFFTLRFENGPKMSLKLQNGWTGVRRGRWLNMQLAESPWTLTCTGTFPLKGAQVPQELKLQLSSPHGTTTGTANRAGITVTATPTSRPTGTAHAL